MDFKKLAVVFGIGIVLRSLFANKAAASTPSTPSSLNSGQIDFRTTDTKESRSTRNNNPGNVKKPGSDTWQGTEGYDELGHAIFKDYIFGSRAMIKDVMSKINRGLNTIEKFINVYCPASDNCPVESYIKFIEKATGLSRKQNLSGANPDTLYKILQAMAMYESGNYSNGQTRTKFNRFFFDEALKLI